MREAFKFKFLIIRMEAEGESAVRLARHYMKPVCLLAAATLAVMALAVVLSANLLQIDIFDWIVNTATQWLKLKVD